MAFRLEESFHFSKNFFCKDAKGPFVSCNVFVNDMNDGRFNQIMANSKARKCLFIDLKKAIVFHRSRSISINVSALYELWYVFCALFNEKRLFVKDFHESMD